MRFDITTSVTLKTILCMLIICIAINLYNWHGKLEITMALLHCYAPWVIILLIHITLFLLVKYMLQMAFKLANTWLVLIESISY